MFAPSRWYGLSPRFARLLVSGREILRGYCLSGKRAGEGGHPAQPPAAFSAGSPPLVDARRARSTRLRSARGRSAPRSLAGSGLDLGERLGGRRRSGTRRKGKHYSKDNCNSRLRKRDEVDIHAVATLPRVPFQFQSYDLHLNTNKKEPLAGRQSHQGLKHTMSAINRLDAARNITPQRPRKHFFSVLTRRYQ
jgi:hypothetical protein